MQIFELHFNPKNKEGKLIDTFCYQPEDVYEKRLGALAIAGELTQGSSNKTLLNNLASKVKGTYHSLPTRTQEEALREGLKEGNKFLTNQSWEGNLNLAILSIKSDQLQFSKVGDLKILLSRNGEITNIGQNAEDEKDSFGSIVTGKIKKRDKLIILTNDIYLNFANEDLLIELAEDKPLDDDKLEKISKVQKNKFPKTSGVCLLVDFSIDTKQQERIVNKDEFSFQKLMTQTGKEIQETSAFLLSKTKNGSVEAIREIRKRGKPTIIKGGQLLRAVASDIRKVLKKVISLSLSKSKKSAQKVKGKLKNNTEKTKKKEGVAKSSGQKRIKEDKELKRDVIEEINIDEDTTINKDSTTKKEDSAKSKNRNNKFKEAIQAKVRKLGFIISKIKSFVVEETKEVRKRAKEVIRRIKKENPLPEIPNWELPNSRIKKQSLYLVILLAVIILVGSITAHIERSNQLEDQRARLLEINEKIKNINTGSEETFSELLYHYENLDDLTSRGIVYQSEAERIKSKTSQKLLEITKTEIIEDPEVLFRAKEIVPSKIELINGEIYSYNPFLSNAEKYNPQTEEQLIRPVTFQDGGIFSLSSTSNYLLFFSRPNEVVKDNEARSSNLLTPPYASYSYQELRTYQDYLYFLEREDNQIIRYHQDNLENPEVWIEERRPGNIRSFSIDGSIWMLKDNNEIWQYENRRPVQNSLIDHQELFPLPDRFTTIRTAPDSPLYILEPRNNRVIVSSKEGELLKQIILPQARNIKDLAIGQNKIYLLDSQEVYVLEVDL